MSLERGRAFLKNLPGLAAELPFAPDILATLYSQTAETHGVSFSDVAATIAADQGLTTRVLALANSAFYGLRDTVSTPERAVALVGLDSVRTMVLAIGMAGLTSRLAATDAFDLADYLRHQVLTAVAAGFVADEARAAAPDAPHLARVDSGEMFTSGILHDVGKVLIALNDVRDWDAIAAIATERGLRPFEAEQEYWGLDHAVAGGMALTAWGLPSVLVEPVSCHHDPPSAPEALRPRTELLLLADALAHLHTAPDEDPGPEHRAVAERYALPLDDLHARYDDLARDEGTAALIRMLAA